MKLTEQDIKVFKSISGTETGNWLVDYSERLVSHICDARNMTDEDSKESVVKASKIIEEHLINKIKNTSKPKSVEVNPYN